MISSVVGVRMSVPTALPNAVSMRIMVVDFEVVVRVPSNTQGRFFDCGGVVRRTKVDVEFEVAAVVRDCRPFDLLGPLETLSEIFQDRTVDRGRAPSFPSWR